METGDIEALRNDLVRCLDDLSRYANPVRGKWVNPSENPSDLLDQANRELEMDFAFFRRLRDGRSKGRILSALKKIEDGRYGICEACEEEIPARRLKAIPDAIYCYHCQTRMERENA